ncbi:MAG: RNA polymerase subunit sigma-70 [Planctomycetota bacterium]|nr:MAG: RNA polymerase subunit sigma-70 [Planctomycetota bacterium]
MTTTLDAWQDFQGQLFAFIRKKVNQLEDAEDILQDVFLKIHKSLPEEKIENYKAWLYKITKNTIYDFYKKKRIPTIGDEIFEPVFSNAEIEERELSHCLTKMIEMLPENDKEALQETGLKGKSQVDYAKATGLSIPGAKSRVQRAREKLMNSIKECCQLEYDRRGNIVDLHKHGGSKESCSKCN